MSIKENQTALGEFLSAEGRIERVTEILFKPLRDDIIAPHRGSDGAAGWDIHAAEDFELKPYEVALIPTGLQVAFPDDCVLFLLSRSGFSIKNQIIMPNSVGVIDSDYRGEMKISALWTPPPHQCFKVISIYPGGPTKIFPEGSFHVKKGDRIAQCVLLEYRKQDWSMTDELPETIRGTNGFGSTGIRPK